MSNTKGVTPPNEEQIVRVLNLFQRASDFQRGKVLGKLEAYVEQADSKITTEAEKAG